MILPTESSWENVSVGLLLCDFTVVRQELGEAKVLKGSSSNHTQKRDGIVYDRQVDASKSLGWHSP